MKTIDKQRFECSMVYTNSCYIKSYANMKRLES